MRGFVSEYFMILVGYIIIYLLMLKFKKKEAFEEELIVTKKAKTFVQCVGGNHTLVKVPHTVLIPPAHSREGVMALKGVADRNECTVCVHTGAWDRVSVESQVEVSEVSMDVGEYSEFVDSDKTLILTDSNMDIVVQEVSKDV